MGDLTDTYFYIAFLSNLHLVTAAVSSSKKGLILHIYLST